MSNKKVQRYNKPKNLANGTKKNLHYSKWRRIVDLRLHPIRFALISTSVLVVVAIFILSVLSGSNNMGNMGTSPSNTSLNLQPNFIQLAAAHTDVCRDLGNEAAMKSYMDSLPPGSLLQGSCCTPMDSTHYNNQISSLKQYANIVQIPSNPYSISVKSAKQMIGYYDDLTLNTQQQTTFDNAALKTDDKGWCCCQCWAWYTHAGLAKFLITQYNYTAAQIVAVTNLEDCCGGA